MGSWHGSCLIGVECKLIVNFTCRDNPDAVIRVSTDSPNEKQIRMDNQHMSKTEQAWADLFASTLREHRLSFRNAVFLALIWGLAAGLAAGFFFFMQ
jgi:hypothetical protein